MLSLFKLIPFVTEILQLINKFYDEYIRRKYKSDGKEEAVQESKVEQEKVLTESKEIKNGTEGLKEEDLDKELTDFKL